MQACSHAPEVPGTKLFTEEPERPLTPTLEVRLDKLLPTALEQTKQHVPGKTARAEESLPARPGLGRTRRMMGGHYWGVRLHW